MDKKTRADDTKKLNFDGFIEYPTQFLCDNMKKFIFYDEDSNMEEYLKDGSPSYRYTIDMDARNDYMEDLIAWKKNGYDKRCQALRGGSMPSEYYSDEYSYYVWYKNADIALFDKDQMSALL